MLRNWKKLSSQDQKDGRTTFGIFFLNKKGDEMKLFFFSFSVYKHRNSFSPPFYFDFRRISPWKGKTIGRKPNAFYITRRLEKNFRLNK